MKRIILFLVILAACTAASAPVAAEDNFTRLMEAAAARFRSATVSIDTAAARYEARLAAEAAADSAAAAVDSSAAIATPVPPAVPPPPVAVPPEAVVDTGVPKQPAILPPADTTAPAVVTDTAKTDTATAAVVADTVKTDTAAAAVVADTVKTDTAAAAVVADTVKTDTAAPPPPVLKVETPPLAPPKTYPVYKPEIEMIPVKGGKFKMGCRMDDNSCVADERPIHEVRLGSFLIGKYPVTQKQWKAVMGLNPSHFDGDDRPVEQVSWDDIQEFIRRLNKMTGRKFRLPTEAEWEYAARGGAGSSGVRFWGNRFLDDIAWHEYNSHGKTHPVGQKKPNELGLHDMLGNVWEWVNDYYDGLYYRSSPVKNPHGPRTGAQRVYRGNSFVTDENLVRISLRNHNKPGFKAIDLGFRLAETP